VKLRSEGRDFPLLDWDQVRELRRRGFDIGAHGVTHANLGLALDAEREVSESVERVAAETGDSVQTFAYPYGGPEHRSEAAARAVQSAGCLAAFAMDVGVVGPDSDCWALPRLSFTRTWPFAWAYQVDRAFSLGS
jgi:peptidoglycan/xylan/chitin deacetylase (PgdA/CDA1 family)